MKRSSLWLVSFLGLLTVLLISACGSRGVEENSGAKPSPSTPTAPVPLEKESKIAPAKAKDTPAEQNKTDLPQPGSPHSKTGAVQGNKTGRGTGSGQQKQGGGISDTGTKKKEEGEYREEFGVEANGEPSKKYREEFGVENKKTTAPSNAPKRNKAKPPSGKKYREEFGVE